MSSPGLAPTCPATADRLQHLWSRPAREVPAAWSPPEPVLAAELSEAVRNNLYRSLQSATRGSGAGERNGLLGKIIENQIQNDMFVDFNKRFSESYSITL